MSNIRNERIKAQIIRDISEIIQFELGHLELGFLTISDARVSNDYGHAWIYVSFFDKKETEQGLITLNKAKGYIRTLLAKRLNIRKTPELHFEVDEIAEKAERLEAIFQQNKKEEE
ncbi:MAG: 30S ribosome-binding factor RbfA [Bacilli bacterium]|jgi:ribosome-binding factor A|nr:30S ribosome-binding factor RbfA [Bacilli bacterium]MDD3388925.1 30S ribosome-binding factor RbfA [Bacilli bacterium]MDD4344621.1 30S ribosome-binding factor RbfA [Bacilli bacterium]MDD4520605.1 30S ribosome-binding factor RbfA [Bacilli bacterium]MDY0399297.1 30S ribosome-binding factor RbfA [Bacilli bacterium]